MQKMHNFQLQVPVLILPRVRYVWLAITAHKDKVWRGRAGVDPGFSDGGGGGGGGANGNAWPHGHGKGLGLGLAARFFAGLCIWEAS